MTTAALDHVVIAAASLVQGAAWCEATFGVLPGPGGKHALFGTHNRLLKIATPVFPELYLEIIAIDPDAPAPVRPRWFGLDSLLLQQQLKASPRLLHVVARTRQLDAQRQALLQLGQHPGEPVSASRETPTGLLEWQILVRPDGQLACAGALPTLIQWRGQHPSHSLAESPVGLQSLGLRGLDEGVRRALILPGVDMPAEGHGPALTAVFDGPRGPVVLSSS